MRWIDLTTWDRTMHYQIFRDSAQPQYCVTFDVDVTNFLARIKERGYSFTFAFVYAVTKCANQIEAFRCRFVDGKPAVFERINTSFTYLNRDTELFKVVNVPMQDTMEEYVALARAKADGLFYRPDGKRYLPVFPVPMGFLYAHFPYRLRAEGQCHPAL